MPRTNRFGDKSHVVGHHIRPLIESTINAAWTRLLGALKKYEPCVVPTFTFEGPETPDYSHPVIQHLYILKFFPAYLFKYTEMYLHIFKKCQEAELRKMNILSLGCGCGLDFYGLHFAQKIFGITSEDIQYCGIDPVNWQYQDIIQETNIKHKFEPYGIEDPRIKDELQSCNIIVFPKSLSGGISEKAWQSFWRSYDQIRSSQPMIVAASVMSEGMSYDMEKLLEVSKRIAGQEVTLELFDSQLFNAPKVGIRSVPEWGDWVYPDDIYERFRALPETCINHNICTYHQCCSNPCAVQTRNIQPMLKHELLQYRIGVFR